MKEIARSCSKYTRRDKFSGCVLKKEAFSFFLLFLSTLCVYMYIYVSMGVGTQPFPFISSQLPALYKNKNITLACDSSLTRNKSCYATLGWYFLPRGIYNKCKGGCCLRAALLYINMWLAWIFSLPVSWSYKTLSQDALNLQLIILGALRTAN
jgi:hypothetical protein